MTTMRRHGGGMPSKGSRQLVGSRIPIESVPKLRAAAAARQMNVSDFLADLIQRELDLVDVEPPDAPTGTADLLAPAPRPTLVPPRSQDRLPQEKRKSN